MLAKRSSMRTLDKQVNLQQERRFKWPMVNAISETEKRRRFTKNKEAENDF